jgi:hypothetical protein
MPTEMKRNELRRYAILGAEARLLAIAEEAAAIYRVFPELREQNRTGIMAGDRTSGQRQRNPAREGQPNTRRGSPMSEARRKAVGERMKKYWAARRAEMKGSQTAEGNGSRQPPESDATPAPRVTKAARRAGRAPETSARQRRGRRRLSAAARKRISEAQKARWAKRKRARATAA